MQQPAALRAAVCSVEAVFSRARTPRHPISMRNHEESKACRTKPSSLCVPQAPSGAAVRISQATHLISTVGTFEIMVASSARRRSRVGAERLLLLVVAGMYSGCLNVQACTQPVFAPCSDPGVWTARFSFKLPGMFSSRSRFTRSLVNAACWKWTNTIR